MRRERGPTRLAAAGIRARSRRVAALATAAILVAVAGWSNSSRIADRIERYRVDREIASGNLDGARARLDAQIRQHPAQAWPRALLAGIARRLGRITEAEELLQRAVELGLPVAEVARERALLGALADFGASEVGLLRALEDDPGNIEIHRALADGYARTARWDAAARAATAWLSTAPGDPGAALGRAQAHRAAGRVGPAIEDCRSVLARTPGHFEARLLLAEILLEARRPDEAGREVALCRARAPDRPEPLLTLAASASARGDLGAARSILERALRLAPNFAPTPRALALIHQARGRDDLARPLLDRATLLDPDPAPRPEDQARRP